MTSKQCQRAWLPPQGLPVCVGKPARCPDGVLVTPWAASAGGQCGSKGLLAGVGGCWGRRLLG